MRLSAVAISFDSWKRQHTSLTEEFMTFWDFANEHPLATLFYVLVAIYGVETFIKACRSGARKKRRR